MTLVRPRAGASMNSRVPVTLGLKRSIGDSSWKLQEADLFDDRICPSRTTSRSGQLPVNASSAVEARPWGPRQSPPCSKPATDSGPMKTTLCAWTPWIIDAVAHTFESCDIVANVPANICSSLESCLLYTSDAADDLLCVD